MKSMKKTLAGMTLVVALVFGWFVAGNVFQGAQYARAQAQVDAARQSIANVQDMANMYKAVNKVLEPSVVKIEVEIIRNVGTGRGRGRGSVPNIPPWFPDLDNDGQPDLPEGLFDFPQGQRRQEGT